MLVRFQSDLPRAVVIGASLLLATACHDSEEACQCATHESCVAGRCIPFDATLAGGDAATEDGSPRDGASSDATVLDGASNDGIPSDATTVEEDGATTDHCLSGARDEDETDVDCGGSCGATCELGETCEVSTDCRRGTCDRVCRAFDPACRDGLLSPGELNIDCGGMCGPCGRCEPPPDAPAVSTCLCGFAHYHPAPDATVLNDIAAVGDELWAVGERGKIVQRASSGAYRYHWVDGAHTSVAGASPTRVFVGDSDVLGHIWAFDGARFTEEARIGFPILAMWATGSDELWAVGSSGGIAMWDGQLWSRLSDAPESAELIDVWAAPSVGSGISDVWVVASVAGARRVLHFDGLSWTTPSLPDAELDGVELSLVWGNAADDVWVVGQRGQSAIGAHWDGTDFGVVPLGQVVGNVTGMTEIEGVLHLAADGSVHRIETAGGSIPQPVAGAGYGAGIANIGDAAFIGTGDGYVLAATAGSFDIDNAPLPYGIFITAWGAGPDDVWAGSTRGYITHWNGSEWRLILMPGERGLQAVRSLWGFTSNDLWATAADGVWRCTANCSDGANWARVTTGAGRVLRGVWGSDPQDVWFVGDGDAIMHFTGAGAPQFFTHEPFTYDHPVDGTRAHNFYDAYGTGPDDVWAVGDEGLIARWDGTSWDRVPAPTEIESIAPSRPSIRSV